MVDSAGDLSAAEQEALRATLAELGGRIGHDLEAVFNGLMAGLPMDQAMGLPGQTVDLLYAQAISRFNSGDITQAAKMFLALTVLAPRVRDHWLGLGICQRMAGNAAQARSAVEAAQALEPDSPAVLFHLCELCCLEKDWRAAKDHLARFAQAADTAEKRRLLHDMTRLSALIELRGP